MTEEAFHLKKVISVLRNNILLIFSVILLSILVVAIYSYLIVNPLYQSSTEILVNQDRQDITQLPEEVIQADLHLINTYGDIMKSPTILNQVIEQVGLNYSAEQLSGKITLQSTDESQVIKILVEDVEAEATLSIGNELANVFQGEIEELMSVDNVSILSPAVLSNNSFPVEPNPLLNLFIAALVGTMLGIALAFLMDYFDTTLKTENDVKEALDIPVLGVISPEINKDKTTKRKSVTLERREA
ncbi:YveK family protein [Planococcus sp. YIM B11945]|uniref:YveK family protein n=1 Tax=Planococcus sp. YIM B11945 TaxID=3435410 RepID=UPI003D7C5B52